MRPLLEHAVRSLIGWWCRPRSVARYAIGAGVVCLTLACGSGWVLDVSIPYSGGQFDISFDTAGGTPTLLVYALFVLGAVLILGGSISAICCYIREQRFLSRAKVVVVEARGLRNASGTPLIDAIPPSLKGHREHVLVDIRQGIKDGEIVDPEAALTELTSLPTDLKRREKGIDRRDLTLVYGGLAPVPFTFLTGVLVDDECTFLVLDWDRHAETWRELDSTDDGRRFKCSGVNTVPVGTREVALAVSVSYSVSAADVHAKVGDIPLVSLDLENGSPDSHWSEDKQRHLGAQFLSTIIGLGNRRVARIHLFLAAPNSVSFRFGRLYDKRNLPEVVVYQYQRGATPPYPWGISMPVSGADRPIITATTPQQGVVATVGQGVASAD